MSNWGPKVNAAPIEEEELRRPDDLMRENEALRGRLSRLSEASLRINQSLDFDTVLQGVLDSARAYLRE